MRTSMVGRQFLPLRTLSEKAIASAKGAAGTEGAGWLTIGVLAESTPVKTGASGGQFVQWTLTDLKGAAPTSVGARAPA
jgi:hypothetical protein